MTNISTLKKEIKSKANPKKAKIYQGFFKTGKGEYGEGDIFYGLTMPLQREIAKKYLDLSIKEIEKLIDSKIHEERMIGLLIWTYQYDKRDEQGKKTIYNAYLKNTKSINNWDLVDVTCNRIVGFYLLDNLNERKILYKLAKSKNLWERRIAIVSTGPLIVRNLEFEDTLRLCKILIKDKHDLIHKACGWMLREVGKKDKKVLIRFLKENYNNLPRTTLRYSIERFPEKKRKEILKGKF